MIQMKKRISVLLALVLLCALTQAAFADEAKENSELAQQIRQMAETLHSFAISFIETIITLPQSFYQPFTLPAATPPTMYFDKIR